MRDLCLMMLGIVIFFFLCGLLAALMITAIMFGHDGFTPEVQRTLIVAILLAMPTGGYALYWIKR